MYGRLNRRPILVTPRRQGPGLIKTMARTAVVAGTATATAHAVGGAMDASAQHHRQEQLADATAMQSEQELEQIKAQMSALQAQQAQAAIQMAASTASSYSEPSSNASTSATAGLAQLQQLVQLKESGMLNDAEFQAAKAKLLGL